MTTFERPLLLSKSIGEKESSHSSLKQHTTALCVPHMGSVQCTSIADGPPETLPDLLEEGSLSCQSTTSSSTSEGQEGADPRLGFFDALALPNEPVTLRGGCSDYLSGLELPTHWPDEKEEVRCPEEHSVWRLI